jgi:pimeloyl-ACP methyl ester carboxylesterase
MKRILPAYLLLPLLLLLSVQFVEAQVPSTAAPGPFAIGEQDVTFTNNQLASPNVDVRIWYPATSAGTNTPVATGQFAILALGHGFNLNYLDYTQICGHLASWGYIVLSPDVQNGFNVDHLEFARELAACLDYMLAEGANATSDFFQKTDTMTGVLGHSMGGGASGLVPSVYPSIDAVSGLAAAETNPSAIAALANYNGPFQTISGSADNTAPESSNQQLMYNASPGSKQWVSITGGAHCKFTDGNTVCDFVSSAGSVTRPFQIYLAKKYTTAFFNYFLKNDQDAFPFLCGDSVNADVTAGHLVNSTDLVCPTTAIDPELEFSFRVFPNPVAEWLNVESTGLVALYQIDGRRVDVPTLESGAKQLLDVSGLAEGLYFLKCQLGVRTVQVLRN